MVLLIGTFALKVGDLLPKITYQFQWEDGSPVELGLNDAVQFRMRLADDPDAVFKVDADGSMVDAGTGQVEYAWSGTDTDSSGFYLASFRVVTSNGPLSGPDHGYIGVRILDGP